MIYIISSFLLFLVTVSVHALLYRKIPVKKNAVFSILVFLSGFATDILAIRIISGFKISAGILTISLPVTSLIVYLLLAAAYLVFFLAPFLGEESPTSTILIMLKRKEDGFAGEGIIVNFSDHNLVKKRIDILVAGGFIVGKKGHYYIAQKGRLVAAAINLYRRLLGWNMFG